MKPFYHDYESWEEPQRQDWIRTQLQQIVLHARTHSAFYREKWDGISFHKDDDFPLQKFPILTTDDLRAHLPPLNQNLLTDVNAGHSVFQSGGTTGTPKTSLFTHSEMEMINQCNLRGFHGVGLTAQDRVANLWAVGGLYMTFIHMNRMFQEYGCQSFPFSNATPFDFIHGVAEQFQINVFSGITSVVLNCLRDLHQKKPKHFKIEKIFFGGEQIYENDRKEMQEHFGVQVIKAPGYGTVDSWYLGYQCQDTPNGVFHAFDDQVYLEILDEETMKPAPWGQVGMLYATVYPRLLTPIVRFRVGDKARWMKQSCSCGRTTPLFELLGRGDDVLRIGYDSIDYNSVQEVLKKVSGASGRLQMEKRRIEGRDQLILRIETSHASNAYPSMTRQLTEIFLEDRPSFREFVKKGQVWPLQVEWCAEGQLPQNPRTGKLIRVIGG